MKLRDLPKEVLEELLQQHNLRLRYNLILDADSYKMTHFPVYPKGIQKSSAYVEARKRDCIIVPFGLSMLIKKFLLSPITMEDIDEAEAYAKKHFITKRKSGKPCFNRDDWEYILKEYGGFIPVKIWSVREGTRVTSQNVLVRVDCDDSRLAWMASYIETMLLRGVWYPSSIASEDYKRWRMIQRYMSASSDNPGFAVVMLHDFAGRGVTCEEQAQIGGAAHTVYFEGSDTISGVRAANLFYKSEMSAYSVAATEHSIQCAFGPMYQEDYLRAVLDEFAYEGSIVSIVLDGYDVYRESELLCTTFHDQIVESKAKIVFRPDSGDPLEVVPKILAMQARYFGFTKNSKGYKVIKNVGIIQGDGIDTEMIEKLLELVTSLGYSAENIVFGSGGGLLQKINRDTFAWAMKGSAVMIANKWIPIFKDPVTDPGKKSKAGVLTLLRSKLNGEFMTASALEEHDEEWEDMLELFFDCGRLLIDDPLDEIRKRARA
jgi:nicotinamide phosphoribosyltransferase